MFTVFEGVDGSGKSTQIQMLKDRIRAESARDVTIVGNPSHTSVVRGIADIVDNYNVTQNGSQQPLALFYLFLAGHNELISQYAYKISKEESDVILIDSFTRHGHTTYPTSRRILRSSYGCFGNPPSSDTGTPYPTLQYCWMVMSTFSCQERQVSTRSCAICRIRMSGRRISER